MMQIVNTKRSKIFDENNDFLREGPSSLEVEINDLKKGKYTIVYATQIGLSSPNEFLDMSFDYKGKEYSGQGKITASQKVGIIAFNIKIIDIV